MKAAWLGFAHLCCFSLGNPCVDDLQHFGRPGPTVLDATQPHPVPECRVLINEGLLPLCPAQFAVCGQQFLPYTLAAASGEDQLIRCVDHLGSTLSHMHAWHALCDPRLGNSRAGTRLVIACVMCTVCAVAQMPSYHFVRASLLREGADRLDEPGMHRHPSPTLPTSY